MRAPRKSWIVNSALAVAVIAQVGLTRPAWAWTDSRPAGLVTEVVVDRDGGATVTLRVRWRVLAGRLHTFELSEIPADATVVEASATDAQNAPVAISTHSARSGQLEVTLGEQDGMRRGTVDVVLRYTTSLRAQGAIVREGADAVVRVSTVPWERGLEAAELRIATPSSIQRARWLADETPGIESTVSSEVGRDVVRAVRRHLPAGARWEARIACDHSLFTWLNTERVVPQAQIQRASHQRWSRPAIWALCALLFGGMIESLRRSTPGAPKLISLGKKLAFVPALIGALGGLCMSLVLEAVRGTLTLGAILVLIATMLVAPMLQPIQSKQQRLRPRAWSQQRMAAHYAALDKPKSQWLLSTTAVIGVFVTGLAFALRVPAISLAGASVTLLALAVLIAKRPREPESELHAMCSLAKSLGEFDNASQTQLAWRVRGDLNKPGAVRLKLVSRRGHRSSRGLRAIEWSIRWEPSWLRWEAHPTLTVRAKIGERLEKSLRIAGSRVGQIAVSKDGTQLAWIVTWSGIEQSIARSLLAGIAKEAFSQVRSATNEPEQVSREIAEAASLHDEPQPERILL